MNYILQHSDVIFGGLLVLIVLAMLLLVFLTAASNNNANNEHVEVIRYSQNGYHSSESGYQMGKFTKNNTYNGR